MCAVSEKKIEKLRQIRTKSLEAGHQLMARDGPDAITLGALAQALDCSHGNILYHFGSIAKYREDLAIYTSERICAIIRAFLASNRDGQRDVDAIVDLIFDVFRNEGAAHLANPAMRPTGNRDTFGPIIHHIHDLVASLNDFDIETSREITRALLAQALGDALLGDEIANSLLLPQADARRTMAGWLSREAGLQTA